MDYVPEIPASYAGLTGPRWQRRGRPALAAERSGVPEKSDLLALGDRIPARLQRRRPRMTGRRGEAAAGLLAGVARELLAERDLAVLRQPALAGPEVAVGQAEPAGRSGPG